MTTRLLGVLAAALLLVSCGQSSADQTERGANGSITAPGLLGVEHLREGDCIRDRLPDVVEGIVGVPCARPHHAQVIAVGNTDTIEVGDPSAIDQLCGDRVLAISAALLDRDDLPIIDVSLLIENDSGQIACILEFSEPITEDLVRTTA